MYIKTDKDNLKRGNIMGKIKEIIPSKKIKRILFYDVKDLISILGLSIQSVRKYLRTGKIKGAVKVGQKYYISSRNFDRWLNKGRIFDKPDKIIVNLIKEIIQEQNENNLQKMMEIVTDNIKEQLEKSGIKT